jgi:GTP-binding protein
VSLPIVAIIGRPNVGKSSLFNRFLRRKLAVVDPESGVTRDRNYAPCEWNGRQFRLVDTGGMVPDTRDQMERMILDQADFAVHEADLVLLVVDTQVGSDQVDERLAKRLHRSGRDCLLIANKTDNDNLTADTYVFAKLGLGEAIPVSATEGLGIGELLDAIADHLPQPEAEPPESGIIRVALVGRPNVGKSSFINQLLGEQRLIVSSEAGTTRDAVDTAFELDGRQYILIDTAGLRRRYKVRENIEFYTNLRVVRAIEDCDVAVVLVDATDGFTAQDQRILAQVLTSRRAAVLAVNKWDLVEKDSRTAELFTAEIQRDLATYSFVPIIFISALTGQRVSKVLSLVDRVYSEHHRRVPTSRLNELLQKAFQRRKPPAIQGKYIQFKYVTQTEEAPPTFVFFTNHPQLVAKTYLNYLSNQLRAEFGFEGSPIRLKCRRK